MFSEILSISVTVMRAINAPRVTRRMNAEAALFDGSHSGCDCHHTVLLFIVGDVGGV